MKTRLLNHFEGVGSSPCWHAWAGEDVGSGGVGIGGGVNVLILRSLLSELAFHGSRFLEVLLWGPVHGGLISGVLLAADALLVLERLVGLQGGPAVGGHPF